MCLGIPGKVVELVDPENGIAKADVNGVRRNVSIQLIPKEDGPVEVGDWILIHVGFAMSKIDEQQAAETFEFLEQLGTMYEEELSDLAKSDIE